MINNFSLDFEFNSSLEEQVKIVEKSMVKETKARFQHLSRKQLNSQ
jgi:hypothetical protein